MAGARIFTVTPAEYNARGSAAIVEEFARHLERTEGRRCYPIPTGGSNALGTFGYVHAVTELIRSSTAADGTFPYEHIVFGCGSGGTAAGLAIGVHLSGLRTKVHAVGVCDSPTEFYEVIHALAAELGLKGPAAEPAAERPPLSVEDVKGWLEIYDGQGLGYALSTTQELQCIAGVSAASGIAFDPVYSGKALCTFLDMLRSKKTNSSGERIFKENEKVLFIHTGGTLGMYDKIPQLLPLISQNSEIKKFDLSP
jgi:D-cysteine desulfhydrase